jgi:hypothetical protein
MRLCPHTGRLTCPAPEGSTCKAVARQVTRYCDLADPEHRDHNPAYIDVLSGETPPARTWRANQRAPRTSLLRKAANLAHAVASHAAAGFPTVSDEVHEARLALCRACVGPEGYYDPVQGQCRHPACGCNMRVKTRWTEQRCPLGKW